MRTARNSELVAPRIGNYADRRREVKAKKSTTKCDEVLPGV